MAAPTMAAAPSRAEAIAMLLALPSSLFMRERWPPAMWPVSCASTPITSFGVLACCSSPVWMKMRWPSATKALMEELLIRYTWTAPGARPATRKTSRV